MPTPAAQVFVARQPIFDARLEVYGYELLFRSGPENFFLGADPDHAATSVIDDAVHVFGLEPLAAGKKLFINCTRRVLVHELVTLLPPQVAVVELLESVRSDAEVLAACRRLKEQGFTLALDDFELRAGEEPLLDLCDIWKVDCLTTGSEARTQLVQRHRRPGLTFLAEKVETYADFINATRDGFSLFQGYFFCLPQMLNASEVPGTKLTRLKLLEVLNAPELDFDRVQQILKQDVALLTRLLKYLNSAAFGWASAVKTVKEAIVRLGERPFRKWAAVVALASLAEGKPGELVVTSLARARFCERVGTGAGMGARELELFLVGLLSALDALMSRPLAELLEPLRVSADVRGALLEGKGGALGDVYRLALAYERGQWETVAALSGQLPQEGYALAEAYAESVQWADAIATG